VCVLVNMNSFSCAARCALTCLSVADSRLHAAALARNLPSHHIYTYPYTCTCMCNTTTNQWNRLHHTRPLHYSQHSTAHDSTAQHSSHPPAHPPTHLGALGLLGDGHGPAGGGHERQVAQLGVELQQESAGVRGRAGGGDGVRVW
jgi:hypothetical protein